MSRKKLVVIGAGEFQLPLVQKAKALGYEVHCFAWEAGAVAKDEADFFYPINITDKEAILNICKDINPCGVLTAGSDLAMPTVAYICEKLNLCCNSYEVALRCTNKYEMRKAMKEAGVKTPFFTLADINSNFDNILIPYPVIVKPSDSSGSRGIHLAINEEELVSAIKESSAFSPSGKAIIEDYIDGNEYSCECVSYNGNHTFLAFTKKFTTGAPDYIETGHIQPDDIPEEYKQKIIETIFSSLDALGVTYGATHTEFKIDSNGNMGIIEIGARMGGGCIGSDLVCLSTGKDFLKMIIDIACGKEPDLTSNSTIYNQARIDFIFDYPDLDKLEQIKATNPESIIRISNIRKENLGKTTDCSNRAGYYITVK
ncbi:MAG: ATP-grasp domain-containing protein [Ruminococcaceae bacterium]|nr:ATP-grasp domain-containing protein [Oscillospiraceae bacterium]